MKLSWIPLALAALLGLGAGWWHWGRLPTNVTPPVSPGILAQAAAADSLAHELGRTRAALTTLSDSLAHLARRPHPAAPLPPRPPVAAPDSAIWAYADTLAGRLAVSESQNDTLRQGLAYGAAEAARLSDSLRADSSALGGLHDSLTALAGQAAQIERERDAFARQAHRAFWLGAGATGIASKDQGALVAGLTVRVERSVLFLKVSVEATGGVGMSATGSEPTRTGPGAALHLAVLF